MTRPNLFLNLFRDKETMSFAAGQFVFKAGDPGEAMYIVTEGEVEVVGESATLETADNGMAGWDFDDGRQPRASWSLELQLFHD